MNQANQGTSSKITNPVRISRIITKMCAGRMQVLIRTKDNHKLGIRAVFLFIAPSIGNRIVFDKVSSLGLEKLDVGMHVKVEVIGMPSKVLFLTVVTSKGPALISCAMPNSLISMERRLNSRFHVLPASMSYISLSGWRAEEEDGSGPPFFNVYKSLASWIPLVDISPGGVCIQSHFPSFLDYLETIETDSDARLHLPMSSPLPIKAIVRWRRRIRNRIIEGDMERYQLDFRVGIEFEDLKDEDRLKIRQYMRQLSIAEAI